MTAAAHPLVAEVADDAQAPPDIALLYGDIRRTLGNEVVNLVFRRLAAQGAPLLAVVWHCLRPAYTDGRLEALAARLLPELPMLPDSGAAGVNSWANRAEAAAMRRIVLAYDRNNRRNLIGFTALFSTPVTAPPALRPPGRKATLRVPAVPDDWLEAMRAAPLASALPLWPDSAALDGPVRDCLTRLDRFGDPGKGPPLASLYRHLAHWPAFLTDAEPRLTPRQASGCLARATAHTRAQAETAARLLPDLAVDPVMQARLEPVIGDLVRRTLPKMVPIGRLLGAMLLPPPAKGDGR